MLLIIRSFPEYFNWRSANRKAQSSAPTQQSQVWRSSRQVSPYWTEDSPRPGKVRWCDVVSKRTSWMTSVELVNWSRTGEWMNYGGRGVIWKSPPHPKLPGHSLNEWVAVQCRNPLSSQNHRWLRANERVPLLRFLLWKRRHTWAKVPLATL